ncbi:KOW domain-containing RNA-binding protein [Clostridium sp. AN503]|uniref:KOW domain-containing RNA-binding protein n=1 Tax=Clostridium sp. AN503 TaxID=3160598 RepID=UPI00345A4DD8
MTYEYGCPARSLAGHDKDQYFIILTDEGEYVTISDGKTRKVENPKRKNKKHIQAGKTPLLVGRPATDEAIRKELENYLRSHCGI